MSRLRSAGIALAFAAACSSPRDRAATTNGAPIANTAIPGIVQPSPTTPSALTLAPGDSVIDLAIAPTGPEAIVLLGSASGVARVARWPASAPKTFQVASLPTGFVAHGIAVHPAANTYYVSGTMGGKSEILAIAANETAPTPRVIFQSSRDIGRLIVGPRPFETDSGTLYRIFFAAKVPSGEWSIRSVTERGGREYQVLGPKSEAGVVNPEFAPSELTATSGVPMSFHPTGEAMLWRDDRGCVHSAAYDKSWVQDTTLHTIPCGGSTSFAPNGNAFLTWQTGNPGITVTGTGVAAPQQAIAFTFAGAPLAAPDGRGVIGVVAKGASQALEYVPIDLPLGDVANAWQLAGTACDIRLFAREGGLFYDTDTSTRELYTIYDRYNYGGGPAVPFLVTTDMLWENFGAAFNGIFILGERQQAIPAFWTFVDSASAALAKSAPGSTWAKAFAAIAGSRTPGASGEAGLVAHSDKKEHSEVLGDYDFGELKPRSHYTSSDTLKQYFRGVHYLTEVSRIKGADALAALPPNVQQLAGRWIEVYRPFIALPRATLVWSGTEIPPVAPYARHPSAEKTAFPLSWGLDNETLESTIFHEKWPPDQWIDGLANRRLYPSGVDIAAVYGNHFARSVLADDLRRFTRLGPAIDGVAARRPRITDASSIYDRWLDALGAEWADSTKLLGVPDSSRLWDAKRLQTGLASWATLREATLLVNERPSAAEAGEGGFEDLVPEQPRGYVEPAPATFEAIAGLYGSLARSVGAMQMLDATLRNGIVARLDSSAAEARRFGAMADRERRGQPLSDADYGAIQGIGGSAEHQFLVYRSLADSNQAIANPDPITKIADVQGDAKMGFLEAAVGNPLGWRQIVPFFGRREIVAGAAYSYYEFVSPKLYDNADWRTEASTRAHPAWVQPYMAPRTCQDNAAH